MMPIMMIALTVGFALLPTVFSEVEPSLGGDWVQLAITLLSAVPFTLGMVDASHRRLLRERMRGQYSGAYRLKAEKSSLCPCCDEDMQGHEVVNVLIQPRRGSKKATAWYHIDCAITDRRVPAVRRRSTGNPVEANRLIVYTHAVEGLYTPRLANLTLGHGTPNGLNECYQPDTEGRKFPREFASHYTEGRPSPEPQPEEKTPTPQPESTPEPKATPQISAEGSAIFGLIEAPLREWGRNFTQVHNAELATKFSELTQEVRDIASSAPLRLTTLESPEVVFEEMIHNKFLRLLRNCRTFVQNRRINSLLVGPAGSGKTFGAEQILRALLKIPRAEGGFADNPDAGIVIVSCNEEMLPTEITGATVPNISDGLPVYTQSKVVEAYQRGGIIVFDEFDRLASGTAVALNAAIAGSSWPLPDGTVATRHEDSVFICTANTFGHGGNRTYNAANQLDGATLNRFAGGIVNWGYDEALEKSFCPNAELRNLLIDAREKMNNANIQRIISPRHLQVAYAMTEVHGLPVRQAFLEALADWNENDLRMIGLDANEVMDANENYIEPTVVESRVEGAV